MTLRQTLFVILLTMVYLCVELAFNARLLDVVGAGASPAQIHAMELFGRSLSGVAVALVVLQLFLVWRNRSASGRPGKLATLFWCLAAGGAVFVSLQLFVDHLVDARDPAFRKASVNIVLLQRALVHGDMVLDGLNDDPALFSKPAGKAFLGLFPLMAASVDQLDEKIRKVKLQLISRTMESASGGPAGYYENYRKAINQAQQQWRRYQGIPTGGNADEIVEQRHTEAWGKYLADLGKRGWTPSTVPPAYHAKVRQRVRTQAPVPADWNLADEEGFRQAVASKVKSKLGSADGSVRVGGQRIPPGLDWPAFLAHPAVQADLRKALGLPAGVRLQAAYASGDDFQRTVFNPAIADSARRTLAQYDAPLASYADGGSNAVLGRDSARAVIVPPVALFFSLMGAIFHLSKLCYLLLSLAVRGTPALQRHARFLWAAPVAVLVLLVATLSLVDNAVTRSRLYAYMREQVLAGGQAGAAPSLEARLLVRSLHLVAVGQDYGYPINELARTRVLGGFNFGYDDAKK